MKRGSLFTENDKHLDTNFRHFLMTPMSLFLVSDPHFCDKRICNKVKWLPLLFSNQSALEIGVTLKDKKTKTFALKMFEVKNGQSAQYPLTSCVFFGQQWLCRCIFLLSFFFSWPLYILHLRICYDNLHARIFSRITLFADL